MFYKECCCIFRFRVSLRVAKLSGLRLAGTSGARPRGTPVLSVTEDSNSVIFNGLPTLL